MKDVWKNVKKQGSDREQGSDRREEGSEGRKEVKDRSDESDGQK